MTEPYLIAEPDSAFVAALAARGLEPRVVSTDDVDAYAAWLQVVRRGFLGGEATDDEVEAARARGVGARRTGVYDPSAPVPDAPVGTVASWIAELSVPGGRGIPSWAVSSVTVAPTHRRRGVARAMLECELRLAQTLGVPMAMLTVSESTLYGRYGFAPAAWGVSLTLDVKRASWIGPVPDGRVDFIARERLRELIPGLHERARLASPGEIEMPTGHWDGFAGTRPDAKEPGKHRAIQYADASGEVRGLAVYTVRENQDDFTKSYVSVEYLLAETPGAYAALWRFFVELDLVGTVEAHQQSVDEPLLWMISDRRAATVTVRDHQYLRIVDVPAALDARRYGASGVLALDVTDPIGLSGGRWILRADADGRGRVEPWQGDAPDDAVVVRLGIAELSAAYLGGVSLATLAAAGRVETRDAATAARVFSWHVPPRLSFWY
ncbi:GNAT family N-acetyltransferase [Microbacterium ulmi]|uniref:GNAT family N-acetyltransferase n=1 Tax=Microbacterium ulmi TaxID=179095 RepID=A0A7Y2LWT0_9MICO|nr:GNAT family N-acetyltransferase [Microbacterium ulmi]NII68251.1 putative acetyltransferase [Microbacterium ulmi]NNH02272.1 GNAT family N-acetyltransferase [Microbacterium ulmi]